MPSPLLRLLLTLLTATALAAGCSSGSADSGSDDGDSDSPVTVALRTGDGVALAAGTTPDAIAVSTSAALYETSSVVLLVDPADEAAIAQAADASLGVPTLFVPGTDPSTATASPTPTATATDAPDDAVTAEVERLEASTVVALGPAAARWAERLADVEVVTDLADAPDVDKPAAAEDLVVLTTGREGAAAVATAKAAGAQLVSVKNPDLRADPATITELARLKPLRVVGLGDVLGPLESLRGRVAVAKTGVQLPGGGQLALPGKRYIALYGHPGTAALGVMGEQGVDAAIARAKKVAAPYQEGSPDPIIPAFEIITTIASAGAGDDGDYSDESAIEHIKPWVDAAAKAGVYCVLDLQPGRTDFLTQAKRYESLLSQPHVGLALDPEWRLKPDQKHLKQIGSVGVDEVNSVLTWLADLTKEKALPQKLVILHQFRLSMLPDRERVDTSRDELAVLVHADGHGSPGLKMMTWRVLTENPGPIRFWGWKNFYDEDSPTFTPAQTLAVDPMPDFISYQ